MPRFGARRALARPPRVTYLLGPFRFQADRAATLPSPYSEPGAVGSLVLGDVNGILSTSGGGLRWNGTTVAGTGLLGGVQYARRAGRALLYTQRDITTISQTRTGFGGSTMTDGNIQGWMDGTSATEISFRRGGNIDQIGLAAPREMGVVMRSNGFFYIARPVGGAWTLHWVDASDTSDQYVKSIHTGAEVQDWRFGALRLVDLSGHWTSDYGIATQRLAGARSDGDAFVHTANALIEFTVSAVPNSGRIDIHLRRQDASNMWRVWVETNGDFKLIETNAGSDVQRASHASGIAAGHRVVIVADGTTIKGFSNNSLRWTYSSASNAATATDGRMNNVGTGGGVSDLVTWPRTVSLPSGH